MGEGGPRARQAGPRDRLPGARRRRQGKGEEKKTHCKERREGGRRGELRCAVAMRGVWILVEHMKWKKEGQMVVLLEEGGRGRKKIKKERDRCSRILCRGKLLRERLHFTM